MTADDQLANDRYGRTVAFSTDGTTDTYTITDDHGGLMTVALAAGTPRWQAYQTMSCFRPDWYVDPTPPSGG